VTTVLRKPDSLVPVTRQAHDKARAVLPPSPRQERLIA
jgi:hypothetical protein